MLKRTSGAKMFATETYKGESFRMRLMCWAESDLLEKTCPDDHSPVRPGCFKPFAHKTWHGTRARSQSAKLPKCKQLCFSVT